MRRWRSYLLILLAWLCLAASAWADSTVPNLPAATSLTSSVTYLAQGGSTDTKLGFDTGKFCISSNNLTLCSGITIGGNVTFTGVPIFSGLSAGTCSKALAVDSGNNLVTFACSTSVGGSSGQVQFNSSGGFAGTSGITANSTSLTGATIALGSDATGDLYYNGGLGILTRLGVGSAGQFLGVTAGLPAWKTSTGVPGGSNTNAQYNSSGAFAGSTGLTLNGTQITGETLALGSDATGDTYYNGGSGVFTRLGIGSTNQVLTVSGGLPSWKTPSNAPGGTNDQAQYNNSGVLGGSSGLVLGGASVTALTLALGSDATGDLYYNGGSGVLTRLGIGASNQVLTVSGGIPTWAAATGSPAGANTNVQFNNSGAFGGSTGIDLSTTKVTSMSIGLGADATGDTYYNGGAGALTRVGIGANTFIYASNGTGPVWESPNMTLAAGLGNSLTMPNNGTQTAAPGSTITTQLIYHAVASSCSLDSSCFLSNDAGILMTPVNGGITLTLPAPTVTHGENIGYDGSHNYTVTAPVGVNIYGCGTTANSVTQTNQTEFIPDGSNWQCIPSGGGSSGGGGGNVSIGLGAGLGNSPSTPNNGTQTVANTGTIYPQNGLYTSIAASCTVDSNCSLSNDSGLLLTATAASVTFTLPAASTTHSEVFGWDGTHTYTVAVTGGIHIYGCGATSATSISGLSTAAKFTPDGSNWQCLPLGVPPTNVGAYVWLGQNNSVPCGLTESGTTVTPVSGTCPAGAQFGVEFQNVTLAAGANYQAFPTGALIGQPFVFSYTNAAGSTLTLASGYILQGASTQPTLTGTAGAVDKLQCWGDGTGAPGTLATGLNCNQPLTNFLPVLGVTFPSGAHGWGPNCNAASAGTTCTVSFPIVAGQTITFFLQTCGNNTCAGGTLQNVSSLAVTSGTGTIGSCGVVRRQAGAGAAAGLQLEEWTCAALTSGTPTITGTWAGSQFFNQIYQISLANAGALETISAGNNGTGTTASVTATGATTFTGDFCISSLFSLAVDTYTAVSPATMIDTPSPVEYQNGGFTGSTPAMGINLSASDSWAMLMMCFK